MRSFGALELDHRCRGGQSLAVLPACADEDRASQAKTDAVRCEGASQWIVPRMGPVSRAAAARPAEVCAFD
jgi:hypothetical protein